MNQSVITRMEHYETIRSQLKTGDIALFSGTGFGARVIQRACKSRWSHVGLIIYIDEWNIVLQLESNTTDNMLDLDDGQGRKGVQLLSLSQIVRNYNGLIAFRHLVQPLTESQIDQISKFRSRVSREPYETNFLLLTMAPYRSLWKWVRGNNGSLFCSQLVAEAYQAIGLLPSGTNDRDAACYVPGDFSEENRPTKAQLIGNSLGSEITLR